MVNTHGRLIGINTAIATPTGTFAGYSFAVPVNIVKKVVADLMDYGVVQRGYLGVQIDVNRENIQGVYVSEVLEGTGSEEAGIEAGDIITKINGTEVTTFPELQERLSQYGPGDKVKVDFIRDGSRRSTFVQLRNKNKNTEIIKKEEAKMMSLLGADFEDLTLDEKRAFDLDGGVKVSSIYRDGKIYEQTSIREGFVITSIDDETIDTVDELKEALQSKRGGTLVEGFYPQSPYKIYNYYLNIK